MSKNETMALLAGGAGLFALLGLALAAGGGDKKEAEAEGGGEGAASTEQSAQAKEPAKRALKKARRPRSRIEEELVALWEGIKGGTVAVTEQTAREVEAAARALGLVK